MPCSAWHVTWCMLMVGYAAGCVLCLARSTHMLDNAIRTSEEARKKGVLVVHAPITCGWSGGSDAVQSVMYMITFPCMLLGWVAKPNK